MNIKVTPDQVFDIVSALGSADAILLNMAARTDTPGIFKMMLENQANILRDLQTEMTRAYNEEQK